MTLPPVLSFSLFIAAALAGCGEEPLPQVSQENCTFPKMMLIKDQGRREDFKSFCSYIPRSAWPIHPDKWLMLSEEKRQELEQAESRTHETASPLNWLNIRP